MRLQLYLARAGLGSRRKCEEYILDGKVKINGKTVTELGSKVGPDDKVSFKNKAVHIVKKKFYVALNKPAHTLCTNSDEKGRALAIDLIKSHIPVQVHNVGRLDYLSSGLIFFTNDGDFTRLITHPSSQIEKEYIVETKKEISDDVQKQFVRGIKDEEEILKVKSIKAISEHKYSIVLVEGKNREIRRLFLARCIKITRLHRVRIGHYSIGNLKPGHFQIVQEKDIRKFLVKNEGKK
jgi:23S rRNA pseudouridine2605 synthase